MSRYIDADAMMNQWCDEMCKPKPSCEEDCAVYDYVRLAPSIDIEPKRGEWISKGKRIYRCSNCGNYLDFDGVNAGRGDANFCPNCGADMREREGE